MVEQIFMPLANEGIDVWRPVEAYHIGGDVYIVLRSGVYDPAEEEWEFPPGSVVVCEKRMTPDGEILAAVKHREISRRTA